MSELRMNVPEAQSTSSAIRNSVTQLQAELTTLNSRVTSMVGSEWQSNAATQFGQQFQEWQTQVKTLLDKMEELRGRLDREIAEWQEMSARLSG